MAGEKTRFVRRWSSAGEVTNDSSDVHAPTGAAGRRGAGRRSRARETPGRARRGVRGGTRARGSLAQRWSGRPLQQCGLVSPNRRLRRHTGQRSGPGRRPAGRWRLARRAARAGADAHGVGQLSPRRDPAPRAGTLGGARGERAEPASTDGGRTSRRGKTLCRRQRPRLSHRRERRPAHRERHRARAGRRIGGGGEPHRRVPVDGDSRGLRRGREFDDRRFGVDLRGRGGAPRFGHRRRLRPARLHRPRRSPVRHPRGRLRSGRARGDGSDHAPALNLSRASARNARTKRRHAPRRRVQPHGSEVRSRAGRHRDADRPACANGHRGAAESGRLASPRRPAARSALGVRGRGPAPRRVAVRPQPHRS